MIVYTDNQVRKVHSNQKISSNNDKSKTHNFVPNNNLPLGHTVVEKTIPTNSNYQQNHGANNSSTGSIGEVEACAASVRPGVIPQRGAEADAFFKHMIKNYYTIKADTTITAIETTNMPCKQRLIRRQKIHKT